MKIIRDLFDMFVNMILAAKSCNPYLIFSIFYIFNKYYQIFTTGVISTELFSSVANQLLIEPLLIF